MVSAEVPRGPRRDRQSTGIDSAPDLSTRDGGHSRMPTRPAEPCNTPGCPGRTATGGRCDRCRGGAAGTPAEPDPGAVYTTRAWRARRLEYLAGHPLCMLCAGPATVPDHYPISRRVLVARGWEDPDADEHLRPLCKRCHDRSTAARQPGGWNRDNQR